MDVKNTRHYVFADQSAIALFILVRKMLHL